MSSRVYPPRPVLLVDDDASILTTLRITLNLAGITNIICQADAESALATARETDIEAVLLDVLMPGRKGNEILQELLSLRPDLPVIMITGVDDLDLAVACMRHGAFDYIRKPADAERIVSALTKAVDVAAVRRERRRLSAEFLKPAPPKPTAFNDFISISPAMLRIFQYCQAIAPSPEPVLITGETGVGKEVLAGAIHKISGRDGEFVAVNVAGLEEQTFADTLFGHVRGAFTGADRPRGGLMERAAGGTLFLDEIGDLPVQAQIKLLRVLQEREFHPLGSDKPKPMTARIITATNRSLADLSDGQRFRADFFFRVTTHALTIPPLRERPEDIAPLSEHFLALAAQAFGRPVSAPPELIPLLRRHPFPGNARELRALIFDAVGRSQGSLDLDDIAARLSLPRPGPAETRPDLSFGDWPVLPTLHDADRALVAEALKRAGGNQRQAAALLGISPQALCARLKRGGSTNT